MTKTQSGNSNQSPTPGTSAAKPAMQSALHPLDAHLARYTANPADVRASKLMVTPVYNLEDGNIGDVSDLIIANGKTIKAVVVSVARFLGMDERNVPISPASAVLNEQRDGSFRLVVNTTRDDLKNAAPFSFADVDKAGPDAGKAMDTS
jgi:hypothetical protein